MPSQVAGCALKHDDQCNFEHHSDVGETDKSVTTATSIPPRNHSATATRKHICKMHDMPCPNY
eukprot:scaffold391482_cov15-Prasinocladus_malaysianus.AAC.1